LTNGGHDYEEDAIVDDDRTNDCKHAVVYRA
jgi:hypothetical protein